MAGIQDLRIHDCRHEALSRLAETGKFSIPELQVFSGHRDVRMLMRYAHLCASRLAAKLDECFKDEAKIRIHRGRRFLSKHADVKVKDLLEAPGNGETILPDAPPPTDAQAAVTDAAPSQVSNVIPFRPRLHA